MAEVQGTPAPSGHGIKGFMTTNTAGMPNWVWLLVIAAGIGAAYVIPKLLNKNGSSPTDATTTGTDNTSGIGLAVDPTTGLPYAVEGLVPAGGTVGNAPTPTPTPTPTPGGFQWPSALSNMKIWEGTSTHQFFYGPNGPMPDRQNQIALATLFPSGTTFSAATGKAGDTLFYTLPGTTTPVQAPVTLVDPNPPKTKGGPMPTTVQPTWPGDTLQVRMG